MSSPTYILPHADPIDAPRDFPLHRLASKLRGLSAGECNRRAGILRHELDTLKAARRTALDSHDYARAQDLDGQADRVRQAWGLVEDQRRFGFGARGGAV